MSQRRQIHSVEDACADPSKDPGADPGLERLSSESVSARRLRDGRWLVHRRVEPLGDEDAATSALSIDERMPR